MFTKKFLFGFVVVALSLLVLSGTPSVNDNDQRSCDPAGLWFGLPQGADAYKVVSIIPLDGGMRRYMLVAEDRDHEVTPFRGEMVRIKKNHYKIWGMMYYEVSADNFLYIVLSGEWTLTDCNTAVGSYLISYYMGDPFHNTGTYLGSDAVVNTYDRMPMIDDSSDF